MTGRTPRDTPYSVHDVRKHNVMHGICACVLASMLMSACGEPNGPKLEPARMTVEDEIWLPDTGGRANAITDGSDGIYAIAGTRGTAGSAWILGVDAQSKKIVWRFDQPKESSRPGDQSTFTGIVRLANGNYLFCGQLYTDETAPALIRIVNSHGVLVEERRLVLNPGFFVGSFSRCIPWQDGVALIGSATVPNQNAKGWLMRLDKFGNKEWERLIDGPWGNQAVESPWGDLLVGRYDLTRINRAGEVVGHVSFPNTHGIGLVNSPHSLGRQYVITYIDRGDGVLLHTLNEKFEEAAPIRPIAKIHLNFFDAGAGYVLSDGTLALFGSTAGPGAVTAAIARVTSTGETEAWHMFDTKLGSLAIRYAVPLAANRFVAVRENIGGGQGGIVLTWVTFN